MIYLATSRHENLRLDLSCPLCTENTHVKFKALPECRVIHDDLKNCELQITGKSSISRFSNSYISWGFCCFLGCRAAVEIFSTTIMHRWSKTWRINWIIRRRMFTILCVRGTTFGRRRFTIWISNQSLFSRDQNIKLIIVQLIFSCVIPSMLPNYNQVKWSTQIINSPKSCRPETRVGG